MRDVSVAIQSAADASVNELRIVSQVVGRSKGIGLYVLCAMKRDGQWPDHDGKSEWGSQI